MLVDQAHRDIRRQRRAGDGNGAASRGHRQGDAVRVGEVRRGQLELRRGARRADRPQGDSEQRQRAAQPSGGCQGVTHHARGIGRVAGAQVDVGVPMRRTRHCLHQDRIIVQQHRCHAEIGDRCNLDRKRNLRSRRNGVEGRLAAADADQRVGARRGRGCAPRGRAHPDDKRAGQEEGGAENQLRAAQLHQERCVPAYRRVAHPLPPPKRLFERR
jgi:hypothetical protein